MNSFVTQRCYTHPAREAACFCAECRKPFCRECVIEVDGRLTCAQCLFSITRAAKTSSGIVGRALSVFSIPVAIIICWVVFYLFGRVLLLEESARHENDPASQGSR